MTTPPDAKDRAARTYNAAADVYEDHSNTFWERFGRRTIARLHLREGQRVLDVCCGSGASAIPAAEAVGPHGHVIGVDLAENLLALARAKASARGLDNVEFRAGDMLALDEPPFDAVVCVFGIFFVPDMAAAARALWRLVRSGGVFAVTTWGPRWFEPASTAFWDAVREVRPDLHKGFNPWESDQRARGRAGAPRAGRRGIHRRGGRGWSPSDSDARRVVGRGARFRVPGNGRSVGRRHSRSRPRRECGLHPAVRPAGGGGECGVRTRAEACRMIRPLSFISSLAGAL